MKQSHDRPVIEWIFGAFSAAMVAGLMLFLLYHAIATEESREKLAVTVERIQPSGDGLAVQVRLVNGGDRAIAAVSVQASAEDQSFEPRAISFDYVAANSVRRGVFMLPSSANSAALNLEVGGYVIP